MGKRISNQMRIATREMPRFLWVSIITLLVALFLGHSPALATEDSGVKDENISIYVENELKFDQATPFNKIDVSTHQGVVTLTGTVNNLLAKQRSVEIAETVRGVRSVVDRIEVEPAWHRLDSAIKEDMDRAFLNDSATESWEIGVTVQDNIATLTGTVDSRAEMDKAIEQAYEGGAVWVRNELTIQ